MHSMLFSLLYAIQLVIISALVVIGVGGAGMGGRGGMPPGMNQSRLCCLSKRTSTERYHDLDRSVLEMLETAQQYLQPLPSYCYAR